MTAQHMPEVLAIEASSFHLPWVEEMFAFELQHAESVPLVALIDEGVAGYLICRIIAGQEAELMKIAVSPRMRGHGIGRALIMNCIGTLKARGVISLHLEVRQSNDIARALYDSVGFEESGRRNNYYSDPTEDALLLRLEL